MSTPEADATAAIWTALREVNDPEFPISVVDMGLIVSAAYEPARRAARLQITYTAMGCPAVEMIQDDIRARLLQLEGLDRVDIEVVWDPAWTRRRLSPAGRAALRKLGVAT